MVIEALAHYKNYLEVSFISNVEGDHHEEVPKGLNHETTLFIIVSKTFTTQETFSNAESVRSWFLKRLLKSYFKYFIAVSTNLEMTLILEFQLKILSYGRLGKDVFHFGVQLVLVFFSSWT